MTTTRPTRRQSADPLERLDTPACLTRALLRHLPALHGMYIVEPCAGANAITRVLEDEAGCCVAAFDIEPRAEGITQADTMTPGFFEQIDERHIGQPIACVTNTPFSLADGYWRRTKHFSLVVLLVRITWLEATHKREDVRDPDALIILPRTKFTGPGAIDPETGLPYTGGDNATVCWALWAHEDRFLPTRSIIRVNRRDKAEFESKPIKAQRSLLEANA